MELNLKEAVLIIMFAVIGLYMVAYTLPGAASYLSNSTGAWPNPTVALGGKNNGISPVNTGVYVVGTVIVILVVMVSILVFYVKYIAD